MEKSLISEIKRYHEIMGIKSVILEQKAVNQAIEKGLERFGIAADKIAGRGENLFSKLEGQMEKMSIPKTELESLTAMFERGAEKEAEEKLTRMLENEPFRRAFTLALADEFPELLAREAETFAKGLRPDVRDALSAIYKAEGSEGVEKFLKSEGLWNDEYADIYRAFRPAEEAASTAVGKTEQGAGKEWEKILQDADDMAWKKPEFAKFKSLLRKSFPKASETELNALVARLKKSSAMTKEEFAQEMDNIMNEFAPKYVEKLASQSGKLTAMERWSSFYESLNALPYPMNKVARLGLGLAGTYGMCEAFLLAMKIFGVSNQTCVGFVGSVLAKLGTSKEGYEEVKKNLSGSDANSGGGSGTGTVTPAPVVGLQDKEEDLKKYLNKRYNNMDFSVLTITKESDGTWSVKGPRATLKFVFDNGTFEKR